MRIFLLLMAITGLAYSADIESSLSSSTYNANEIYVLDDTAVVDGIVLSTNTVGSFVTFIDSGTLGASTDVKMRIFWSSGSAAVASAGAFGEGVFRFDPPVFFLNGIRTSASACQTFNNARQGTCYTVLYREISK